ncbi:FAD:protein FMN transferase [Buchnera aphidicola]|uniref:FAD:protein FMN transferase n=1 Tax=Buchnera aphidicola TaxID=9 RepID=UPI0034641532
MLWTLILNIIFIIILTCTGNETKLLISKKYNFTVITGKTMGTTWKVKLLKQKKRKKLYLKSIIQKILDQDEQEFSTWKKKSTISKFNKYKENKLYPINKNMQNIITIALTIGKKTSGALDITIGQLVNMWGFGAKKTPKKYPSIKKINKTLFLTGLQHLQIIQNKSGYFLKKDLKNIQIDLSTLGEGFAVDHIADILNKEKISNYIITVGGAVFTKGSIKKIGIKSPIKNKNTTHIIVYLKNKSISTSGNYLNYFYLEKKNVCHIIDPLTGLPIQHNLISVSIIANNTLEADAWDTGLMVTGFKKAKKIILQEKLNACLIIKKNNKLLTWISPEFKRSLI